MRVRLVLAMIASLCFAACTGDQTRQTPLASAEAQAAPAIEPEAVQALAHMITYLRTLRDFQVTSDTMSDQILEGGLRLRFGGRVIYRVRNPDAFAVDIWTDRRWRQFFYDGHALTMVAPRSGFYTEINAPPSITGALQVAARDYGVALPLTDLFIWSGSDQPSHEFAGATTIGYARIGGADTMHYAFREGDLEWQIWIASGAQPLPRQIVITNTSQEGWPSYTARLSWDIDPNFNAGDFAFQPAPEHRRIPINLIVADVGVADAAP